MRDGKAAGADAVEQASGLMAPALLLPGLAAGAVIGLILGLVGGGGSIVAVPLLVYGLGTADTHMAIGTAAMAVALNALVSLGGHARAGTVKWRCAAVFAVAGSIGAAVGARMGQAVDGDALLALFGLLMVVVGGSMLVPRKGAPQPNVRLTRESAGHLLPRLIPLGLAVGLFAGFFGIGGGFLIVPALMLATAMPIGNAIGTSLVVVATLGATTAASYALAGQVDWGLTAALVAGGAAGAVAGIALGKRLAAHKQALNLLFALGVIGVGLMIAWKGWPALTALVAAG